MLINAALKKGMWFLMTNYIKFCLKMIQKHEKEYPDLPTDILVDIIDVTLNRAPALYFTREQVQNHQEFCIMCGKYCKYLDCKYFNGKTCYNHGVHYTFCKDYPLYDLEGNVALALDPKCNFAIKITEIVLDKEIKKNLDLLGVD